MKYTVVTTIHREGLEQYGIKFLQSFDQNWPYDVSLVVYAEGWTIEDLPDDLLGPHLEIIDLLEASPQLVAFKAEYGDDPRYRGVIETADGDVYNYRFDAIRFSHKVFAIYAAHYRNHRLEDRSDYLIWLDADTITHSPMPIEFLDSLLPEGRMVGYLHRHNTYPECGFIIFDVKNSSGGYFLESLVSMYVTGDMFELAEWHDSFVFGHVLGAAIAAGVKARSISNGFEDDPHPFVRSELGKYMDHLKGPDRKVSGASFVTDVGEERSEDYWSGLANGANKAGGFFLPASDVHFPPQLTGGPQLHGRASYQHDIYCAALGHTDQRRVALDIGAHVGLWSWRFAHDFEQVMAFEPVQEFAQLYQANIRPMQNFQLNFCALGHMTGNIKLVLDPDNTGHTHVANNSEAGSATHTAKMVKLDELGYEVVDLIKIDAEGFEAPIVIGALGTIMRCHPTIVIEQKGDEHYGQKPLRAVDLLKDIGMEVVQVVRKDYILRFPARTGEAA